MYACMYTYAHVQFHLEVENLSVSSGYENVAFHKPATQSSTYSHSANPVANKAVDGNTNGIFIHASTTHTNEEAGAWWQVDLGSDLYITAVTVYNRVDCCGDRLQNFDVILRNSHGTAVQRFSHGTGVQAIFVFKLAIPSQARFVKVQLQKTGFLQLAEVQVFSGMAHQPVSISLLVVLPFCLIVCPRIVIVIKLQEDIFNASYTMMMNIVFLIFT